MVISLSLNDSAHNILNDVLKLYGLVGSLLFNGFSVFDGFPGVCHPLECNLSDRWHGNVLLEPIHVLILFSGDCFFDIISCFCHTFD